MTTLSSSGGWGGGSSPALLLTLWVQQQRKGASRGSPSTTGNRRFQRPPVTRRSGICRYVLCPSLSVSTILSRQERQMLKEKKKKRKKNVELSNQYWKCDWCFASTMFSFSFSVLDGRNTSVCRIENRNYCCSAKSLKRAERCGMAMKTNLMLFNF